MCGYYALRGVSLLFLPYTLGADGSSPLAWFAVFYGLDWVATVPPTLRLTSDAFGRENTGVIFGWIGASHQLGASMAALGAGTIRSVTGDYSAAFWIAGTLCIFAGLSLHHRRPPRAASRVLDRAGADGARDGDRVGELIEMARRRRHFHAESGPCDDA